MRIRRFGKTDLNLSVFTLGTKKIAFPASDPNAGKKTDQALQTIRRAVELGVNHIVTARSYGNSDDLVGMALEGLDRSQIRITAKLPLCESADAMRAWLDDTLKRLRADSIDLLTLHGINTPACLNKVTSPTGCMKAVEEAQAQGLIKHLGFSSNGSLEFILKAMDTELFDAVHVHFSYFNQRNLQVLQKAAEMDIGVLISSPTERGGSLYQPPPLLRETCEPFHPVVVNDRFVFQYPAATSVTITPSRPDDFDVHRPAFDNDGTLTDAETVALARMDVRRLQIPDTWCTFCHDCLPCPENINIPEILRLRNMALAYDMVEHSRSQYKWLGNGNEKAVFQGNQGEKCTECGDCMPRCPQKLEIPKLLFEAHRAFSAAASRRKPPTKSPTKPPTKSPTRPPTRR